MAFDGIMVAALCGELNEVLSGGRIARIAEPDADSLLITIKTAGGSEKLLLCARPQLPLAYLTEQSRPSPDTAPAFCMLLRKHLAGGRILSVTQPGLERVLLFTIEHRDELGDLVKRRLRIELMGKHSNIILCDENDVILDAIRRVPAHVSSVREVLPGRSYFIPDTQHKADPLTITQDAFSERIFSSDQPLAKALSSELCGISAVIAWEICARASIDGELIANSLSESERLHLHRMFTLLIEDIKERRFSPVIYYRDDLPIESSAILLSQFDELASTRFESPSRMLEQYYAEREVRTRMHQRSADLRSVVQTLYARAVKKCDLQKKQLRDTEGRDKYRIFGELLNAYGYSLEGGEDHLDAENYYDGGKSVRIPLDATLGPSENAQRYFARYNKLKRTAEDLQKRILETEREVAQLDSIRTALDLAENEQDLSDIRRELEESAFVKKRKLDKKARKERRAKPLCYRSSDGFLMYVGKNNLQNEEVSFKIADGEDWWFHAKQMPGSHVIVRGEGNELPDRAFEEAAGLAAYYSSGRNAPKVEIDYTKRKNLKKTQGGAPGFVIYHSNYSLMAAPDISALERVEDERAR